MSQKQFRKSVKSRPTTPTSNLHYFSGYLQLPQQNCTRKRTRLNSTTNVIQFFNSGPFIKKTAKSRSPLRHTTSASNLLYKIVRNKSRSQKFVECCCGALPFLQKLVHQNLKAAPQRNVSFG